MTILYFVRHCKTDHSGKRITGTIPGVGLNPEGIRQANRIADYFAAISLTAIYASTLERAMETAGAAGKGRVMSIQPVNFLKEINFGAYQGKGEDLAQDPLWNKFLINPATVCFPGGESVIEAQSRIVMGLNELSRNHTKQEEILCVAHCEILRLAIASALMIPLDEYMRVTLDTGSISKLDWTVDKQKVYFLNHIP